MLLQQASAAVGKSKVQGVPQMTVLLVEQVMSGGVVSTTVIVWLQELVLPGQQPEAIQVRVMRCGQKPLVTVLILMTFADGQQLVETMGGSKAQAVPH